MVGLRPLKPFLRRHETAILRPKGVQLSTWIQRRAETHGGFMNSECAGYLAGVLGDNLFALDQEVQNSVSLAKESR